jgi:ribosome-binding protein aMBF1 (putative translation factor)
LNTSAAPDKGIPPDQYPTAQPIYREPGPKSKRQVFWEKFGENIGMRMQSEGLTKSQLATKARISRRTLERVLEGKTIPTLSTLEGLTYALHFPFTISGRHGRHAIPDYKQ